MHTHLNHLVETSIADIRPTQMTFGQLEVRQKVAEWRGLKRKERERRLARSWFPGVLGPKGRCYITDHHHLGLALLEEGVSKAWVAVLDDLSWLDREAFWRTMEYRRWAHPYDERGRRREFSDIPKRLDELRDDPYRGLAGLTRQKGGFAKDIMPYSEFLWADYFRRHISVKMLKQSPAKALSEAIKLARGQDARYLPGWTGTSLPRIRKAPLQFWTDRTLRNHRPVPGE